MSQQPRPFLETNYGSEPPVWIVKAVGTIAGTILALCRLTLPEPRPWVSAVEALSFLGFLILFAIFPTQSSFAFGFAGMTTFFVELAIGNVMVNDLSHAAWHALPALFSLAVLTCVLEFMVSSVFPSFVFFITLAINVAACLLLIWLISYMKATP